MYLCYIIVIYSNFISFNFNFKTSYFNGFKQIGSDFVCLLSSLALRESFDMKYLHLLDYGGFTTLPGPFDRLVMTSQRAQKLSIPSRRSLIDFLYCFIQSAIFLSNSLLALRLGSLLGHGSSGHHLVGIVTQSSS